MSFVAATGDLVGPYRLVSLLGKGAMGEVWRARDERLDRYVALKIMPAEIDRDVERRTRMLREAKAAAAIRHANVVTLFDIVKHAGDDILVMELVEGRTLSDTLRKDGPPTLEVALRWIQGVAEALVAAHARGILHRDIKAANIMVTPDGVKVLDFGLAKLRDGEPVVAVDAVDLAHAPPPNVSNTRIALDETMPSEPTAASPPVALSASPFDVTLAPASTAHEIESYRTHAGQLIGTPLYMAPEQIAGAHPDERSEVFSVGVLAHEILVGKSPYTATTMDALFRQITSDPTPPLPDVPNPVEAIVMRALAKDPATRYPSMLALRDAVAAERARLFAPRAKRWPIVAGALALVAVGAVVVWQTRGSSGPSITPPPPALPGDNYVSRALEEYDVFYGDKALSSLRAAVAIAPDHPRANAYMILFGGASDPDREAALAAARRARPTTDEHGKDRALLDAAIALVERGPRAAREAIAKPNATPDRELAFWTAELDYRAGEYAAARTGYKALLASPSPQLRGRIYDHYSSVLLYLDIPDEALVVGKAYRDAFPGEADAVGVHATTLAAAGQLDPAIAAAEEALRLNEGEDTLAGLGKVVALAGDRPRARDLYERSLAKAGPTRRPLRRAALAFLQWADGDLAGAATTIRPCLPGGADATARERGACLFVAGLVDPAQLEAAALQLDALAADASDTRPAYGSPASLAALLRARSQFLGGGCLVAPATGSPVPADPATLVAAYSAPLDFYAAYHVPYFATWAVCEHAALLAATDRRADAVKLLEPVATRAPGRRWLLDTLARYR